MLLFGYNYVDPLEGEFPPVTAEEAGAVVRRTRGILSGRTRLELDQLISEVNQFLRKGLVDRHGRSRALAILAREATAAEDDDPTLAHEWDPDNENPDLQEALAVDSSEVRILLWAMGKHELVGEKWSHLFAAFALALLNEAADAETYYSNWQDEDSPFHEWRILYNVTTWIKDALEAAAFAEALAWGMPETRHLGDLNQAQDAALRKRVSAQAREAAFQRHAPTDRAVLALYDFYCQGSFPSKRAATLAFCEAFPALVRHLAPTNRLRTLADGLGRQLQGKRRSS